MMDLPTSSALATREHIRRGCGAAGDIRVAKRFVEWFVEYVIDQSL